MKWMLSLLLAMLIASPALGQLTREEAKILLDASARMTADTETIKAELATMKTELALVKAELGMLKADVADLKTEVQHLDDKLDLVANTAAATQAEVRGNSTRTSELHSQMNSQTHALLLVAGLLATVLLWMLKKEWDARRGRTRKKCRTGKRKRRITCRK